MEMDHDAKEVHIEELLTISETEERSRGILAPTEQAINMRLTSPLSHTYVDTEKISFERCP